MRLKPHAGMGSLLKQANCDAHESPLADFPYQREVETSRYRAILFHAFTLRPSIFFECITPSLPCRALSHTRIPRGAKLAIEQERHANGVS
jgi:hypothetical protein